MKGCILWSLKGLESSFLRVLLKVNLATLNVPQSGHNFKSSLISQKGTRASSIDQVETIFAFRWLNREKSCFLTVQTRAYSTPFHDTLWTEQNDSPRSSNKQNAGVHCKAEELKTQRAELRSQTDLPSSSRISEKAVSSVGFVGTCCLFTSFGDIQGPLWIPLLLPGHGKSSEITEVKLMNHWRKN